MLGLVESLIRQFEAKDIRYCHWKSNEYVSDSLDGDRDLDLLCDGEQTNEARSILFDLDFKRLNMPLSGPIGLENYIGFDAETGTLVHVHLHFELTLGTPFVKEYTPPWTSFVLDARTKADTHEIYTIDPNVELFLLIVRYAVKVSTVDDDQRRRFEGFLDEYDWLAERADVDSLFEVSKTLLTDEVADRIEALVRHGPSLRRLQDLHGLVEPELQMYRSYSPRERSLAYWFLKKWYRVGRVNDEKIHFPFPFGRSLDGRGVEVAFVGENSERISDLENRIEDWFAQKTSVYSVHFGSDEGWSSLLRRPLSNVGDRATAAYERESAFLRPSDVVEAGILAREAKIKRQKARQAQNRGMIVLMDQFPQSGRSESGSSPRLGDWRETSIKPLRSISRWEAAVYDRIYASPPDVLVEVETETAEHDRPEEAGDAEVVRVSATDSWETALLKIKTVIWKKLT